MSHTIDNLESKLSRLTAAVVILALTTLVLFYLVLNPSDDQQPNSLTVSELIVKDAQGTTRVILSGDVPDAIVDGKVLNRGTTAAGVILYDVDGQERSGYLTFDQGSHVALTLDSKTSQQALFVAGPEGGTAMQIWEGENKIELRADTSGARMTSTKANEIIAQLPVLNALPEDVCSLFQSGIKTEVPEGLPRETVKGICESRYPAEACLPCLPDK